MTREALLLVFLCCSILCHAAARSVEPNRIITKSLVLNNGLDWGKWGHVEYCPDGSFAQDVEISFEKYGLLDADETAVNAVKLYCANEDGHHTGYITSTIGKKGEWKGMRTCPNGIMTGMRAKILPGRGALGDDVAMQNVEMECNYGESTVLAMDGFIANIPDGTWSTWAKCDSGSAICGIEIRYNAVNLVEDDAAVSDMSMSCCSLEETSTSWDVTP